MQSLRNNLVSTAYGACEVTLTGNLIGCRLTVRGNCLVVRVGNRIVYALLQNAVSV